MTSCAATERDRDELLVINAHRSSELHRMPTAGANLGVKPATVIARLSTARVQSSNSVNVSRSIVTLASCRPPAELVELAIEKGTGRAATEGIVAWGLVDNRVRW